MKKESTAVAACRARFCAFNNKGKCKAVAINVGGPAPRCDTFMIDEKKCPRATEVSAGIGACKVKSCSFNDCFLRTAPEVEIIFRVNQAECATYDPRLTVSR